MKKGIQYSHYCGTELQNLIDLLWLAKDDIKKGNLDDAIENLNLASKDVTGLRDKISDLDKINKMDY